MIGVMVFAAILAMPLFRTRTRYTADLVAPRPPQTAFLPTGGSSGSQARAVVSEAKRRSLIPQAVNCIAMTCDYLSVRLALFYPFGGSS